MADFEQAFQYMLPHEVKKKDPGKVGTDNDGGKVRYGLNSKANPDLLARGFYAMTDGTALEVAKEVYRDRYWEPICGDQLVDQNVANKLFDMSVNMGPVQAIKLAQRVPGVWKLQIAIVLKRDGVMGPKSLAAINETDPEQMLAGLKKEWEIFIGKVIEVHPEYADLKDEWETRANV